MWNLRKVKESDVRGVAAKPGPEVGRNRGDLVRQKLFRSCKIKLDRANKFWTRTSAHIGCQHCRQQLTPLYCSANANLLRLHLFAVLFKLFKLSYGRPFELGPGSLSPPVWSCLFCFCFLALAYFLTLQNTTGSSCIFAALVLGSVTWQSIPASFCWRMGINNNDQA